MSKIDVISNTTAGEQLIDALRNAGIEATRSDSFASARGDVIFIEPAALDASAAIDGRMVVAIATDAALEAAVGAVRAGAAADIVRIPAAATEIELHLARI